MYFADGGVVSSIDSEVICRVAVEFFSVGTPVAAVPTGCLPEIILEGVNGSLADEPTALSLKKAMARMLDNLPQLSEGAREDAETRFDPETMLKKPSMSSSKPFIRNMRTAKWLETLPKTNPK